MTRKRIFIGIVLVGFLLALGGNAWADHDRGKRGHRNDKGYHHKCKHPPGHHYGWQKGNGNPHRDRYQHRRGNRHRDKDHCWHRDRHHRKRVVEKHVYHHYPKRHRYDDDRFNFAVSVIDEFFGFAVTVSESH